MEKKYSVNWQNGEIIWVKVDGIQYESPDQIPDPEDRDRVLQLMWTSPPDPELSAAANRKFSNIVFSIFLTIGVLLLVISVIAGVNTQRTLAREVSAPGHVVELVARQNDSGNVFYYPVVVFALPDGTPRMVQLSEGSWPPAYEAGEAVTVLYDAEWPLRARTQSASGTVNQYTLSIITGILGVIFIVVSLFVRWLFKSSPVETI